VSGRVLRDVPGPEGPPKERPLPLDVLSLRRSSGRMGREVDHHVSSLLQRPPRPGRRGLQWRTGKPDRPCDLAMAGTRDCWGNRTVGSPNPPETEQARSHVSLIRSPTFQAGAPSRFRAKTTSDRRLLCTGALSL